MILKSYLFFLYAVTSWQAPSGKRQSRCTYGEECWPPLEDWARLNISISGQLIRTVPSASSCHGEYFNETQCTKAQQGWEDSLWRTSQPGAYTAIAWEMGPDQCLINSSRSAACDQGLVPYYSVVATKPEHVRAAVRFAVENNLYLVIKNTGHDHLGRSSGRNAFSIWTHLLKGRCWHDSFVPKDAPDSTQGEPAVTLQAGEQWIDVYRDASERRKIVHGGGARTVGTSGGWLTGGGHGPFSHFYGLGVDNLLEATLVTAQGEHIVVNRYTDPEYFWALRGGGGSSWGVITSVTYRTHPEPAHIQIVLVQANATTSSARRPLFEHSLRSLVNMTDAGYVGYGQTRKDGFELIMIQPNGTTSNFDQGFKAFMHMNNVQGISAVSFPLTLPTWIDYVDTWLRDPNIAQNVMDASRLLTPAVLSEPQELVDLIMDEEYDLPGFNFIGKVNSSRRNETSVHPIWADSRAIISFGVNWNDSASRREQHDKMLKLIETSRRLRKIVGPDGGTYINEANPFEPDWQQTFWGSNYRRLLRIKREKDPHALFVCNRCVGSDVVFTPW